MELTVTLQPTDRYRPASLGVLGPAVVYVERDGATDLAFIAEPAEMQRLARALDQAAEVVASRVPLAHDGGR
jgi:hypothetical protein